MRRKPALRGLLDQATLAIASVDGPLLRSLRCLLTSPGALTAAYLNGRRKPYTLPLQLFLVANVLFFALQSLVGAKVFATPLSVHLQDQFWSPAAQLLVTRHLEKKHTTLERYAPVFDNAVALNAKSLIVLMVPPFTLVLLLAFFRNRTPFVGHIVFSLHFYTFLLLLFCFAHHRGNQSLVWRRWTQIRNLRSCSFHH